MYSCGVFVGFFASLGLLVPDLWQVNVLILLRLLSEYPSEVCEIPKLLETSRWNTYQGIQGLSKHLGTAAWNSPLFKTSRDFFLGFTTMKTREDIFVKFTTNKTSGDFIQPLLPITPADV